MRQGSAATTPVSKELEFADSADGGGEGGKNGGGCCDGKENAPGSIKIRTTIAFRRDEKAAPCCVKRCSLSENMVDQFR